MQPWVSLAPFQANRDRSAEGWMPQQERVALTADWSATPCRNSEGGNGCMCRRHAAGIGCFRTKAEEEEDLSIISWRREGFLLINKLMGEMVVVNQRRDPCWHVNYKVSALDWMWLRKWHCRLKTSASLSLHSADELLLAI